MDNKRPLEAGDIVLFSDSKAADQHCQLKNFLYFLNSIGAKRPVKFNFIETNAHLDKLEVTKLPQDFLTLGLENGPWEAVEDVYKNKIQYHPNLAIQKYLQSLGHWGVPLGQMSANERKLLVLVRALLQERTYLFLESPEMHLNSNDQAFFYQALAHHKQLKKQVVFIHSKDDQLWSPLANKKVWRASNQEFQIEELSPKAKVSPLQSSQKLKRPSVEAEDPQGQLVFSLPSSANYKKAA